MMESVGESAMDRTAVRLERLERFDRMFDEALERLEKGGADEAAIDRLRTAFAYMYFEARKAAML